MVMFRTAEPLTRRLADVAGDRPVHGSATPPRTFPPLDELDDARLPLLDVAGAMTEAVLALVPSCTCAIVVRAGDAWQCIAWRGPVADETRHRRRLAELDLGRCEMVLARRHLVARLPAQRVAAWLIMLASGDDPLPDRVAGLVHALLDDAGPNLDAAAAMQARDRALRRLEILHLHGAGGRPVCDEDELVQAVAGLWPCARARYVPRDTMDGLTPEAARIVREACARSTTVVACPAPGAMGPLSPLEHVHRLAVAVPGRGAVLVEVAAGGQELDAESVAAAAVVARLFALAERERRLQDGREVLRGIAVAVERARRNEDRGLPPVA
jgi:hypothetical protein